MLLTARIAPPARLRPAVRAVLALLATWQLGAQAQSPALSPDEVRRDLYTLDSRVVLGATSVHGSQRWFGQYRGQDASSAQLLLDIDLVQRDEATGTWTRLQGADLASDKRWLRFVQEQQGQWGLQFQLREFSKQEPRQVLSGLAGAGTAAQTVRSAAPRQELDLGLKRDQLSLGLRKFIAGGLEIQIGASQEETQGARMFGRGTPSVMEFLTEPVDRVTRQWQVQVGKTGGDRQFTLGYNASRFDNAIPVLTSTGGNTTAFGPAWLIAMAPSNSAHQLHAAGGLRLGDWGRASAKVSRTVALQDQPFDAAFTRLADAPASLQGRLVTTLAYADLAAWAGPVDFSAQVRHEDRQDDTPLAPYIAATAPTASNAGLTGFNKPRSLTQDKAALSAHYRVDEAHRLGFGLDLDSLARDVTPTYRRMAFRADTDENTLRFDVKRLALDTFGLGLTLQRAERTGSEYVADTYVASALSNQLAAIMWADRMRHRARVQADWVPNEKWSLTLVADETRDSYSGRTLGVRAGRTGIVTLDAAYNHSENWQFSAWHTNERTKTQQQSRTDVAAAVAAGGNTVWQADILHTTQASGVTVRGKVSRAWQLGADLGYTENTAAHDLQKIGGAGTAAVASLPGIYYREASLKLFGETDLSRNARLRLEAQAGQRRNNDWTWDNWVYNGAPSMAAALRNSDGTTVSNVPRENVVLLGVKYTLRWR